jgi:hypothetical protein
MKSRKGIELWRDGQGTGIGIEDKDGKRDWGEGREKGLERRTEKNIGETDGKWIGEKEGNIN